MVEPSVQSSDKVIGHALIEQADIDQALTRGPLPGAIRFYAITTVAGPIGLYAITRLMGQPFDVAGYAPTLGFGVLFVGLLMALRRFAARKPLEGKTHSELDTTYELDANGYVISTASTTARTAWQAVHHVAEVKSAFLIFITPQVQMVWPKRAFAETDVPRVRALLQSHVQPKGSKDRSRLWTVLFAVMVFVAVFVYNFVYAPPR